MDNTMYQLHIHVGRAVGEAATCGEKIDYQTEESAINAADYMNGSGKARKELGAYPCCWCVGWHIGGKMSADDMLALSGQFIDFHYQN